jgi:hypothetical protein
MVFREKIRKKVKKALISQMDYEVDFYVYARANYVSAFQKPQLQFLPVLLAAI